jgi:hypothetical protein
MLLLLILGISFSSSNCFTFESLSFTSSSLIDRDEEGDYFQHQSMMESGGHYPSASAAAPTWGPTPPPNINK